VACRLDVRPNIRLNPTECADKDRRQFVLWRRRYVVFINVLDDGADVTLADIVLDLTCLIGSLVLLVPRAGVEPVRPFFMISSGAY
jgi:hypothetical protein